MNKFKLALLAIISASLVGCGGGGGGGGTGTDTVNTVERDNDGAVVVVDDGVQRHPTIIRDRSDMIKTLAAEQIDLNGDGLLDIAMFRTEQTYENSYVEAFINNGDRTFTLDPTIFASVGNQFRPIMDGIQKADLNADGKLDFVTGNDGCFGDHGRDDCLPPVMSKADGTYEVTTHPLLAKLGGGRSDLVDFDNDGDMDILFNDNIVNNHWQANVVFSVYENRSENGVAKFVEHKDILGSPVNNYGHFVNSVAVIDLNGDGLLDFMWGGAKWGSSNYFVNETITPGFAYNKGNFKFQMSNDIWLGNELETYTFYMARVADFDADGDMDIFVADTGWDVWDTGTAPGAPDTMLWNVNGKFFVDKGSEATWGYAGFSHQMDIADIDNDGDMDIVTTGGGTKYTNEFCFAQQVNNPKYSNQVFKEFTRVMLNDGAGNFTTSQTHCHLQQNLNDETRDRLAVDPWFNRLAATLFLADLDGDGNVDYFQGDTGYADDFISWGDGSIIDFNRYYSFDGFTQDDVE